MSFDEILAIYDSLLGCQDAIDLQITEIEKEIRERVRWQSEYGKGFLLCTGPGAQPTWSEVHPKGESDPLLVGLKAMLKEPESEPTAVERYFHGLVYRYEVFKRKHTDVAHDILKVDAQANERRKKAFDADKARMKHWPEIEAKQKEQYRKWELLNQARQVGKRCSVVSKLNYTRH